MQYDYIITLRRPNYRGINGISQMLLLLFVVSFLWTGIQYRWQQISAFWVLLPVIVVVLWVANLFKSKRRIAYYRLPLLISAGGWFALFGGAIWWLPLLYAVLALLEPQIKFPDEIGFTKEKIVRSTFPRQVYQWIDVDTVMIRNNLFTLDLRNNKLLQKELETPVSKAVQEEFNAYCQQQLHFTPEP